MADLNFVLSEDIVSRTNQDGTVIIMKMDEGNTFFKINGVAAEIWNDMARKKTLAEIKYRILNEYDIDSETLDLDVNKLLNQLEKKELIKQIFS